MLLWSPVSSQYVPCLSPEAFHMRWFPSATDYCPVFRGTIWFREGIASVTLKRYMSILAGAPSVSLVTSSVQTVFPQTSTRLRLSST